MQNRNNNKLDYLINNPYLDLEAEGVQEEDFLSENDSEGEARDFDKTFIDNRTKNLNHVDYFKMNSEIDFEAERIRLDNKRMLNLLNKKRQSNEELTKLSRMSQKKTAQEKFDEMFTNHTGKKRKAKKPRKKYEYYNKLQDKDYEKNFIAPDSDLVDGQITQGEILQDLRALRAKEELKKIGK